MPTPYSGVAGATQFPSPKPAELAVPILNIPTGGDRGAAVWAQPIMTIADWIAFIAASLPPAPFGTLLSVVPITSGTSRAKAVGCTRARIRLVGAGGGGAGVATGANGSGGGGASGGYAEWLTNVIPATWAFTIGAAGAAGTPSSPDGSNGGNTTINNGVTTVTAFGGGGGYSAGGVPQSLSGFPLGRPGLAPALSTNGTINGSGEPGGAPGSITRLPVLGTISEWYAGQGGSSLLGGVGGGRAAPQGAGNNGIGYGAGGSGALPAGLSGGTGGVGTTGAIILEEYS